MPLEQDILKWNEKSRKDIEAVYRQYNAQQDFLEHLIALLGNEQAQCGATWLIKHHLEAGGRLPDATEIATIFHHAPAMEEWESRLHILQAIHHFVLPNDIANSAHAFFQTCLKDQNKFVRAWAYSALGHLASQHEQYREEVFLLLHEALDKEIAGSIRSRLNKALKMLK